MFIIKKDNRRFNNKCFATYEEARKYVRRKITQFCGKYFDSMGVAGFSITRI